MQLELMDVKKAGILKPVPVEDDDGDQRLAHFSLPLICELIMGCCYIHPANRNQHYQV